MPQSLRILICATQVPFVRGGAEYLVEGLREALAARGHTVDVVALPYQWHPVERIPESALAWRLLDISQANGQPVDLVIATKFPSYLVRHPNKVVWLVHQHRQAYDWYGTPLSDFANTPEHRQVRDAIMRMDRAGLGECRARYSISRNVSARLRRFNGLEHAALSAEPLRPPVAGRSLWRLHLRRGAPRPRQAPGPAAGSRGAYARARAADHRRNRTGA